uniref:Uncharacterized protein n=1 Tax=Romanomermis culicivorax TaxID=13658 RepID=A0A915KDP2_ROMCU
MQSFKISLLCLFVPINFSSEIWTTVSIVRQQKSPIDSCIRPSGKDRGNFMSWEPEPQNGIVIIDQIELNLCSWISFCGNYPLKCNLFDSATEKCKKVSNLRKPNGVEERGFGEQMRL